MATSLTTGKRCLCIYIHVYTNVYPLLKKKQFVSHAKLHVTYILYKKGEHTYIYKKKSRNVADGVVPSSTCATSLID